MRETFNELIILGLIIAVVMLAFKTAGLVPKETFDSALDKGFGVLAGLADQTKTPIDNNLIEFAKPILIKWLDDELAKRATGTVTLKPLQTTTTSVQPITKTDFTVTS